jgi:hypothetical protein
MPDCECLKGCLFFNDKMPMESGMGKIFKGKYCQGDNSSCARHMVFKKIGREKVPSNLYPNMNDRAKQIIEKA